ncbi:MAG: transglutaminase domain-containing protein [Candidatus Acidiferrales bacterium]
MLAAPSEELRVRYAGALAESPTVATLRDLPVGGETRQTLRYMRSLVLAALADPQQQVRELALSITAGVPERDWSGNVAALQAYVRDNIKFQRDPEQFELVQTPAKTIEYAAGDCDDKSTLLAALLASLGHPVQFIAVGFNGEPMSHVLVRTKIGDLWTPAETILPGVPVGWWPSGVTSHYILKI